MSLTAANVFGLFMIFVGLASIGYTMFWMRSSPRCPQCLPSLRVRPANDVGAGHTRHSAAKAASVLPSIDDLTEIVRAPAIRPAIAYPSQNVPPRR